MCQRRVGGEPRREGERDSEGPRSTWIVQRSAHHHLRKQWFQWVAVAVFAVSARNLCAFVFFDVVGTQGDVVLLDSCAADECDAAAGTAEGGQFGQAEEERFEESSFVPIVVEGGYSE